MIRRTLTAVFFFALLTAAVSARAQQTAVTGTVTDPSGIPYSGATLKLSIVPSTGGNYFWTGGTQAQCVAAGAGSAPCNIPFTPPSAPITLDTTGSFQTSLYPNGQISPAGTQWKFQININSPPPLGVGAVSFSVPITIVGATQDISATLHAAAPSLLSFPIVTGTNLTVPLGVDSGVANAYVITTTPAISTSGFPGCSATPCSGQVINFTVLHPNTAASTMNVDGSGVIGMAPGLAPGSLGGALTGGEMTTGVTYGAIYDGHTWDVEGCLTGTVCGQASNLNLTGGNLAFQTTFTGNNPLTSLTLYAPYTVSNAPLNRYMLNFVSPNGVTGTGYAAIADMGMDQDGVFITQTNGEWAIAGGNLKSFYPSNNFAPTQSTPIGTVDISDNGTYGGLAYVEDNVYGGTVRWSVAMLTGNMALNGGATFTQNGATSGGTTFESAAVGGTPAPICWPTATAGGSGYTLTSNAATSPCQQLAWTAPTGGISGLTTGFLPVATSSTAVGNSLCDQGITTANVLTCTDTLGATFAAGSVTGSATSSFLNVTGTWNTTGVIAGGIFENITNTASAIGSKLINLEVGGSSSFNVDKSGILFSANSLTAGGATIANGALGLYGSTSGQATFTAPAVAGTRTNAVTMTNAMNGPAGSVTAPTYSFTGFTNYGMSMDAGGNLALTGNGAEALAVDLNGIPYISNSFGRLSFEPPGNTGCYMTGATSSPNSSITFNANTTNACSVVVGRLNELATGQVAGTCVFAAATTCSVTYAFAYNSTPVVIITPVSPAAALFTLTASSTTGFTITGSIASSVTVNYIVAGNPN